MTTLYGRLWSFCPVLVIIAYDSTAIFDLNFFSYAKVEKNITQRPGNIAPY